MTEKLESKTQARRQQRPFTETEYADRLRRVRRVMAERQLDGMLISSPENIYYLTGLNYLGYFAYQLLVVPLDGKPALVTRAMALEQPQRHRHSFRPGAGATGTVPGATA